MKVLRVLDRIHLSKADITELEERYVLDALRSGWVAPLGPAVDAFEAEVAERTGRSGGLALSSGTAGLHLGLLGLGARPGRVVVVPTMTFAASAFAVMHSGAEPVFVDCMENDANVDPDLLMDAVDQLQREGADVCAAMCVDLFGRACDYDRIVPRLAERGVPLIEDAAEALGATYRGRPAGSFGAAAALSFNGNKIMTTSGGGMLLSDDTALLEHARKRSTQSREAVPWYEHAEVGYNYRLSNLLAALGRAQLSRLDEMIARRRAIRRHYAEGLADQPVTFLARNSCRNDSEDNHWLTTITLDEGTWDVDAVVSTMNSHGIEVRHLWKPMHLQPVFSHARKVGGKVAEGLFKRGLALPSGSQLSDDDVDRVISALRSCLGAS